MTPQPDEFGIVYYDHNGETAELTVYFKGPTAKQRAIEWRDEQEQIAAEINSWVDEELKDYDDR